MADLKTFNQTITNVKTQEYLASVLGEKKQAFVNNMTALVSNDKALQACDPMSLMFAALKVTSLDLPLDNNLGFAHVIPYKNNKENKTEAQVQLGYGLAA
jgi:recombination protein RecT